MGWKGDGYDLHSDRTDRSAPAVFYVIREAGGGRFWRREGLVAWVQHWRDATPFASVDDARAERALFTGPRAFAEIRRMTLHEGPA